MNLPINRVEQSPCSEVTKSSVKEIPRFIEPGVSLQHSKEPTTSPYFKSETFLNVSHGGNFYDKLLAFRPTSKLEDHVLSDVCVCLFNIYASTFIMQTVPPSPV